MALDLEAESMMCVGIGWVKDASQYLKHQELASLGLLQLQNYLDGQKWIKKKVMLIGGADFYEEYTRARTSKNAKLSQKFCNQ